MPSQTLVFAYPTYPGSRTLVQTTANLERHLPLFALEPGQANAEDRAGHACAGHVSRTRLVVKVTGHCVAVSP